MDTVPAATCGIHTENVEEDSALGWRKAPSSFSQEPHGDGGVLPAELLAHVFMLGSEDASKDNLDPFPLRVPHFGTICSLVCKRWRDVATDTARLWDFINFKEGPPFEKSREWILRSKAVPLVVDIYHDENDYDPLEGEEADSFTRRISGKIAMMVDMIIPHANRLFSLKIDANRYDIMWIWVKHFETWPATPILETLSLTSDDSWELGEMEHFEPAELRGPQPLFLDAPNLNTVMFRGVHIDWETAGFVKNLNVLDLAYHKEDVRPSMQQFIRLLSQSPYLKTLSLEYSAPVPGPWPYPRISLELLHKLSIVGIDSEAAIAVVEHLEFPALRNLTLNLIMFDESDSFVDAVCSGDRPRFRDVEVLTLMALDCDESVAVQFFECMPKLSSMTVDFNSIPPSVYDALVKRPDGSQPICPVLTTLESSGLPGRCLRNLIVARKTFPEVESIQALYLDVADKITDDTVEWLESNVQLLEFSNFSILKLKG